MKPLTLRLSIRTKIVFLIVSALSISGVAFVLLGTQLIIKDKTSYIYDYSSSEVSVVAEKLSKTLEPLQKLVEISKREPLTLDSVLMKNFSQVLGGEVRLRNRPWSEVAQPSEWLKFSPDPKAQSMQIDFKLEDGTWMTYEDPHPMLDFGPISKDFSICVMATHSPKLIYPLETLGPLFLTCNEAMIQLKTTFQKGTQEVSLNKEAYLLTYQSILKGDFMVLGLIPNQIAFQSAQKLFYRSLVLGLSLFFFTLGIALFLVRTLISRIEDLTEAAGEIGKGNFDFHFSSNESLLDEVSILKNAFSVMGFKIKQLLADTVAKARMEKELETAQMVQKKFLPSVPFLEEGVSLSGQSLSATECGGDFWQYARVQDYLVIVFGDITGHGVPAALLTASLHGVFTSFTSSVSQRKTIEDPLAELMTPLTENLNTAVFSASQGDASFPCVIGIYDFKNKNLWTANYGHPPAFFWKNEFGWSPQASKPSLPLGTQQFKEAKATLSSAAEGMKLFFYTDGLFEMRARDEKKLDKKKIIKLMSEFTEQNPSLGQTLPMKVMDEAIRFFGSEAESRPDDITLVQFEVKPLAQSEEPQLPEACPELPEAS